MKTFFMHLVTGIDGETYDPSRVFWMIGIVVFLSFVGFGVYKGGDFDLVNFGIAYATLLGGGAAGVKIKESTEPPALDTPPTLPKE